MNSKIKEIKKSGGATVTNAERAELIKAREAENAASAKRTSAKIAIESSMSPTRKETRKTIFEAKRKSKDTVTNTEDTTTVNKAFIYTGEAAASYNAIKVFATDDAGNVSSVGYNFDTALPAVEGNLQLAVEIQGISEDHKDNIQVYLSSAAVKYKEGETTEQ